jgi:hypothetical protein
MIFPNMGEADDTREGEAGGMRAKERLFDADHHGIRTNKGFHASIGKTCLFHPSYAIRTGEIETSRCFYQHVQAHHQAECVL